MPFLEAGTRSKDKTSKKYKPSIKKFFDAQTERILIRYYEFFNINKPDKAVGDEFISSGQVDALVDFLMPEVENELLRATTDPMHTSGLQKSIDDVNGIADTSVSSSLSNAKVSTAINQLGTKITRVNFITRAILQDVIITGIDDNQSIFAIANSIQDTGLNEFYSGRALNIARTETRLAYDAGGRIAYEELGVDKFDVVGCVGTLAGVNDFGYPASYGDFSETTGSCGVLGMPMNIWDGVSGIHHPGHNGVQVAAEIPMQE